MDIKLCIDGLYCLFRMMYNYRILSLNDSIKYQIANRHLTLSSIILLYVYRVFKNKRKSFIILLQDNKNENMFEKNSSRNPRKTKNPKKKVNRKKLRKILNTVQIIHIVLF